MSTEPTLDEQVEALFPVGGPYGDEETRAAGRSIAALVRYLCHAARHGEAVPEPATVDDVLGSLSAAVAGLDQLLPQLAYRLGRLAGLPGAYATGDDSAPATASMAGMHLDVARRHLDDAHGRLAKARNLASHIGLNLPEAHS